MFPLPSRSLSRSEQYEAESFPRCVYSGFMLEKWKYLDRQIREKCLQMSAEEDGERVLALAEELEQLFASKDQILQSSYGLRSHPVADQPAGHHSAL